MYSRVQKIEPLNEIIEGLFLGDHVASGSKHILDRHGITHVLTIGSGLIPKYPQKYTYKWV